MYTLVELKKKLDNRDFLFVENFDLEDLKKIVEGWEEDISRVRYLEDLTATNLK